MANKSGSPNYFVTQTNPEIFGVTPRPGGMAKIDLPPKRNRLQENASKLRKEIESASKPQRSRSRGRPSKSKSGTSKTKASEKGDAAASTTTAARKSLLTITTAYEEPKDMDIDSVPREFKVKQIMAATPWSVEFDEYLEPSEESKRIPDPFQDSVDMLAMSISVIMLLSRGYDKVSDIHYKWVLSYLDCIKDEFGQTPPNVQGILNHINQLTGGKIKSYLDEEYDEPTSGKMSNAAPDAAPEASATPDAEAE